MWEWGQQQLSQIPEIERVGFVSFDILDTLLSNPLSFNVNWGTLSFIAVSRVYKHLNLFDDSIHNDFSYVQGIFNTTISFGLRIYNIIIPASLFEHSPTKLKKAHTTAHQVGIIDVSCYLKTRDQLLSNQVLIVNTDMSSKSKNGTEEARRAYIPEIIGQLSKSKLKPVLLMNKQAAQELGYSSLCEVVDSVEDNRYFHSILFTSTLIADLPKFLHRSVFSYLYFFDIIATDIKLSSLNNLGNVFPFLDEFMMCSDYSTKQVEALYPEASTLLSTGYLPVTLPERLPPPPELKPYPKFHFVVGNFFPHKLLKPALKFLCNTFPNTQFVALGKPNDYDTYNNLHVFESSVTSDEIVDALYQYSESIIYPSIYEGFGYPWVKGLAMKKNVWVYDSMLIDEIANAYRLDTTLLHKFSSLAELQEQFSSLISQSNKKTAPSASSQTTIYPHHNYICDMLHQRIIQPPTKVRIKRFD
ncbi:glycosyltransferase [Hydromonas duriensis]|nr:glycosyltransferase [Hydromonas duriensis]